MTALDPSPAGRADGPPELPAGLGPPSHHELCEQARATSCTCGAAPGQPCNCGPDRYHLARFVHARRLDWITQDDIAYIIRCYTTTVPDGAA